ncbi:MAG TPA: amidohydrolase family protein [Anaerolineae bacterium]|nr:amidohydrolase family protein [Anaerolineae bacterium]
MIVLPGLIDAHVHLRTPGQTHKEDLDSGTRAALAGGFTRVLDMPNTTPPIVDAGSLDAKLAEIQASAHCQVGQFLGGTASNVATAPGLAHRTVGLKLYLNQTHGPLLLSDVQDAVAHMRRWPGVVAVHAEGWQLVAAIGLARLLNRPVHCCHVARAAEIELIRRAKETGAPITCEVTPHHLYLTEVDARRLGSLGRVKPTLGSNADRQALWDNLDVVDCVASDHAPHTLAEKGSADPPPGVPGLETMLPLLLTAVHEGRLSLERVVELLYEGPRRVYGLPAQPETGVEVDLDAAYTLGETPLYTKCGWTPFAGMRVHGRVRRVTLRGLDVLCDGRWHPKL